MRQDSVFGPTHRGSVPGMDVSDDAGIIDRSSFRHHYERRILDGVFIEAGNGIRMFPLDIHRWSRGQENLDIADRRP